MLYRHSLAYPRQANPTLRPTFSGFRDGPGRESRDLHGDDSFPKNTALSYIGRSSGLPPGEGWRLQIQLADQPEIGYVLSMLLEQRSVRLKLVVMLFLSGVLQASSLSGVVLNLHQGSPIPRARISLHSQTARLSRMATADLSGRFRFLKLPPGVYALKVIAPNFMDWEANDVHVGPDVAFELPNITLEIFPGGCEFDRLSRVRGLLSSIRRFLFGVGQIKGPLCQ